MSVLELKSNYCKLDTNNRLYSLSMPIIGLTGGIATGKTTAAKILKQKNVPVIDADALVKDIYALEATKSLISSEAPSAMRDNEIDFKELRQLFFKDERLKERLEGHIYGLLPEAFAFRLKQYPRAKFIVYDVPLLFEKGLHSKVDLSLLVYAPRETQISRLLKRDNIQLPLAESILSHQTPIDEKKKQADYVIENTRDIKHLEQEVNKFLRKVLISL